MTKGSAQSHRSDGPLNPPKGEIAERKALEDRWRRYDFIVNTSREFMTLIDSNYTYEAVNDSYCKAHNRPREEIVGRKVVDIWGKKVFRAVIQVQLDRCLTGREVNYQGWFDFPALGHRFFDVTYYPYRNKEGAVTHVVVVTRDITERKQAEEIIRKLSSFPKYNPNPVLEFTADGELAYSNDAALKLAGSFGKDQLSAILPPNAADIVKECIAEKKNRRHVDSTIGERTCSWSFYPIEEIRVVHCYGAEITENKKMEEQIRQSQKMEAVGKLAAGTAHEINNALTALLGMADLIRRGQTEGDEIDIVIEEGRRASNIAKDLLMYARPEPGMLEEEDLADLIQKALKILSNDLMIHNVRVIKNMSPVPAVLADKWQIQQVIYNLIFNARDAMTEGGILDINLRVDGGDVLLEVTDSGMGIPEGNLDKVFEPFFSTKKGKGTGLGLSVVQGIVKSHGGKIDVGNRPEGGAVFRVWLPISKKLQRRPAGTARRSEDIRLEGLSILVVDDEQNIRDYCARVIQKMGGRAVPAKSVSDALNEMEKKVFDVVLCDMIMPDMKGADFYKLLQKRRRPEARRFILMTALDPKTVGVKVEVLPKPLDYEHMVKSFERIARRPGSKRRS